MNLSMLVMTDLSLDLRSVIDCLLLLCVCHKRAHTTVEEGAFAFRGWRNVFDLHALVLCLFVFVCFCLLSFAVCCMFVCRLFSVFLV